MLFSLIVFFSCKAVEPAPEDLDSLNLYMWRHFADDSNQALQSGIENLHKVMDVDNFSALIDGSTSTLEQSDVDAAAELVADDPENLPIYNASRLSGVFFVNKIACSLAGIEPNVYALNQDDLHPNTYDDYSRSYTSDLDSYTSREEDFLSWNTSYDISGFGYSYTAHLKSALRFVPKGEQGFADMLISRTVLREPAYFDEGSTERGLFQDFQMEIYYQLEDGNSFHLYGIWREMILFGDVSFESESSQRLVLDGLSDWDKDMEENCAD